MKRLFILHFSFFILNSAIAQTGTPAINAVGDEGRAPYRTEFISYDIRKEAEAGMLDGSRYFRRLDFKPGRAAASHVMYEATLEIPALWLDRDVYIRDTGRTGRYALLVNGTPAGLNTDSYGTNDYRITPYLHEGTNTIMLAFTDDVPDGGMENFTAAPGRAAIGNLFVWSQPRIHIFDYRAAGYPDPDGPDAIIALDIVLVNSFNTDETVTVGYDIYDPAGKLKEYTFKEVALPGRGCDTVSFRNKVFGTEKFQYSASNPGLYRVIISLKYRGRNTEYIPFRVGFGTTEFDGTDILRNGARVDISAVEMDAPDRKNALDRLKQLKRRGINTVYVMRPQQKWFYDACEESGIYVVDRAAVECDPHGGDRGPGGTIANAPEYLDRFIDRQQNAFHRNKNRANVIGWAIGSDSGNGYNMYKSYQWMKRADTTRMVVYPGARGEWNTDGELPAPKPLEGR